MWIKDPSLSEDALSSPEIDGGFVELTKPAMLMSIGKEEKKPLYLHAAAGAQQRLQTAWDRRYTAL